MKPSPPIPVGLIGCGTIAYWRHLRNLARLGTVRVAGIADPDPEALTRAGHLVDAPAFADPLQLLASGEIRAVVIASPTGLHAEHIGAACRAGKHVYVEKPLAHHAAALSSVRECVGATGLVIAVGHNFRFHPACQRARDRLESGSIGEVRAVFSHFAEPVETTGMPGWKYQRRHGGGVLLDLATHHFDLYRWFLRDEMAQVRAKTNSRHSEQDSACVRASTRGGVDLFGYFAFTSSRSHGWSFHGTRGVLHLDLHSGEIRETVERRFGYGVRQRRVSLGLADFTWRGRKLVQPSHDPSYAGALRAFIDAIADPTHRHPDLATFEDGATAVQAVLDAEADVSPRSAAPWKEPAAL